MENATKALIIAAAILIAIVLISLGVFVLGQGTTLVKENSDISENEISAFNSKFEPYLGKKIKAAKVKQLIEVVNQHNRTESEKVELYSHVVQTGHSVTLKDPGDTEYTTKYVNLSERYIVEVEESGYTSGGLIKKIRISTDY